MEHDVTFLIPVRNGENFIAEAIESIRRQTYTNWTLLVRDNLSRDRTCEIVREYMSDPRVRLLEGNAELSMAGNFNRCLDEVHTPYYMLLCHDDYLAAPHALQAAMEVMREHGPSLPTVYSDLEYVTRDRERIATRRFGRAGLVDAMTLARNSILKARNLFGIPLLARTAALRQHRYDETLPYAIDLDLSIATAKGSSVYHIPEPLIANRYHDYNSTGVLLHGVVDQMITLADRHGIQLSGFDRARLRLGAAYANWAKRAFLYYARARKSTSSGASRLGVANAKTQ
jgi:glycosyltransferase involved in cell wall biosynthesis